MSHDRLKLVSAEFPFADAPDIETASSGYAQRFAGPIGNWLIDVQNKAIGHILKDKAGQSILDVGGGHGQNINIVIKSDMKLTIHGSSPECFNLASVKAAASQFEMLVGPISKLSTGDRSFDNVISLRLLSHLFNWAEVIAELCRVAKNDVIVDFPTKRSFNALEPLLFKFKKNIEKNTRNFLSFRTKDILNEFAKHGFLLDQIYPQFFWPMALHRGLKSKKISQSLEILPRLLGLTRLFGSPIIASFKRQN
jgi:ubiquinone/menaquinone biosynthesis C-methylase UbiE